MADPMDHNGLTRGERFVVDSLRALDSDSRLLIVHLEDGEPSRIETERIISGYSRISELLKEHDFQDLRITMVNGRIKLLKQRQSKKPSDRKPRQ